VSWSEVSQLITALAAVGGLIVSFLNRRKIEIVHSHVEKVERATNGMKAELVKEVREASFAKGVKEEKDREKKV